MARPPDFEQFLRVLRREQPDYMPFYEHLTNDPMIEAILGRPRPRLESSRASKRALMRYYIDYYAHLEFDCLPLEFSLQLFHLGGDVGGGRSWANHERPTISNMEEFEEYPWPDPADAMDYELLDAAGALLPTGMKMASGVAGGVQEHVISLVGLKTLSRAIRQDPRFVRALFRRVGDLILGVDEIIAEREFVGVLRMGDDMGYKHATLLNPKTVREHVLPRHKAIVACAHKHGKPFILHSCGNISEIIDELIDDVGIDGWHSFQDLVLPATEAKRRYGDRVAILGGVDLDVLVRATPAELDQYCKDLSETCKVGGGYAFGTGNSVPDYIPVDNYRLMLQCGKKYGRY